MASHYSDDDDDVNLFAPVLVAISAATAQLINIRSHIPRTFFTNTFRKFGIWTQIDSCIVSWLYTTLSADLLSAIIQPDDTAYNAWTSIGSQFLDNVVQRTVQALQTLHALHQGNMTVTEFCNKLKALADMLRDVGSPLTDQELVINLLSGLNEKFANCIPTISASRPPMTFLIARSFLLQEKVWSANRAQKAVNTALVAATRSTGSSTNAPATGSGSSSTSSNTTSAGAPDRPRKRKKQYNRTGSSSSGVPGAQVGAPRGAPVASWVNPWTGVVQAWPLANFPTTQPTAGVLGTRPGAAPPQSLTAQHAPAGTLPPALYQALTGLSLQSSPPSTTDWVFDSGASSHMAQSSGMLSSISPSASRIIVGNGASLPVHSTGHGSLPTSSSPTTLSLRDVLVSPDNCVSIEFDPLGFSIKDLRSKAVLLRSESSGDLYPLRTGTSSASFGLHATSDVLPTLVSFHAYVQTQFHRPILAFQTDNGREFNNTAFQSFLAAGGIILRLTCPYTSQQNGRAGRILRTLNDSTRTMLIHANVPLSFWPDALRTATYLLNRRPCTKRSAATPFLLLFGSEPDYSHLRLAPRSVPCVFLGYPNNTKGYRCYDTTTRGILTSRHVVFDEHVFPFRQASDNLWVMCHPWPRALLHHPYRLLDATLRMMCHPRPRALLHHRGLLLSRAIAPPPPWSPALAGNCFSTNAASCCSGGAGAITSSYVVVPHSCYLDATGHHCINTGFLFITNSSACTTRGPSHAYAPTTFRALFVLLSDEYHALKDNCTWDSCLDLLRPGLDFDQTFSPVVKPATIRTVLHLAAARDWPVHQLDVKNAFLHGDLTEQVFCQQPTGFIDSTHPDAVCLLRKSLYGLKQAPRAWFDRFATHLHQLGFIPAKSDSSLFVLRHGTDEAHLLLYVDDIVLAASTTDLLHRIIAKLSLEFAMKDLGPVHFFLGIQVCRTATGFFLSQAQYADEVLERAGMTNSTAAPTPVDAKGKVSSASGTPLQDPTTYHNIVGALQYLTLTRPDLTYAVQQACLHMHDPKDVHWTLVKRILRYVRGTTTKGLQLRRSTSPTLVAYSDADWAGCSGTRRSTSGFCVFFGDSLVSWSSKRQQIVSRSSVEAEYRGVANAVAECCWLRHLLGELHVKIDKATLLYCDNVSAVYLTENPVHHGRTKHIELDVHFVREKVAIGEIRVRHVPTRQQIADIMTKGLPRVLFEDFRSSLCIDDAPTAGGVKEGKRKMIQSALGEDQSGDNAATRLTRRRLGDDSCCVSDDLQLQSPTHLLPTSTPSLSFSFHLSPSRLPFLSFPCGGDDWATAAALRQRRAPTRQVCTGPVLPAAWNRAYPKP
ncbi:hypothetical protein HU200_063510 [Digitaria exilis]|uniref:Integrase catalytic domain-containing protein n=1 Tax=Digitaria exilis TaxID=1010633 RepID=A0A835A5Q9_9POAL|nr:hypothetical protein HU200_063510 [Digitaria exilis]